MHQVLLLKRTVAAFIYSSIIARCALCAWAHRPPGAAGVVGISVCLHVESMSFSRNRDQEAAWPSCAPYLLLHVELLDSVSLSQNLYVQCHLYNRGDIYHGGCVSIPRSLCVDSSGVGSSECFSFKENMKTCFCRFFQIEGRWTIDR